jgi:predicted nucleic acid-binding protein
MIALDTNIFIYVLNGHEQFGPPSAMLLKDKEPKTASRLVYAEVLASPKLEDELIRSKAVSFLDKLDIKWQEVNYNVLIEAANLRRQQPGLKLIDALHIASAIIAHAETFFSNDQDLQLLKISELIIKSL